MYPACNLILKINFFRRKGGPGRGKKIAGERQEVQMFAKLLSVNPKQDNKNLRVDRIERIKRVKRMDEQMSITYCSSSFRGHLQLQRPASGWHERLRESANEKGSPSHSVCQSESYVTLFTLRRYESFLSDREVREVGGNEMVTA